MACILAICHVYQTDWNIEQNSLAATNSCSGYSTLNKNSV